MARFDSEPTIGANANTDDDIETKAKSTQRQPSKTEVGVHGLRLKRFEEVVAKLLASVEPEYVRLPLPPPDFSDAGNNDGGCDWLFSALPLSARVVGNHPHPKRARKKEGQLRSMLRGVLHLVPPVSSSEDRPTTIVDFGGGSGHLGIPLALILPRCKIIVVDFNERSINLLHEKAKAVIREVEAEMDPVRQKRYAGFGSKIPSATPSSSALDLRCCGSNHESNTTNTDGGEGGVLDNLFTFCGPVEQFSGEAFDIAIALHLCGEATDVCLRTAVRQKAAAIVVAPCCVGKLSANAFNPDVYHATGQNEATVSYPQSALFGKILSTNQPGYRTQQDWNALAKAADYSDETQFRTSRNASRRTAKALLETDRRRFLQDHHSYETALTKMDPLEVTPKNDILVAWRPEAYVESNSRLKDLFGISDTDCKADIEVAKAHLLSSNGENSANEELPTSNRKRKQQQPPPPPPVDRNDWAHEEEAEIKATILAFLEATPNEILVFPTRMGGRKRKLIHFVAGKLNLAHWGQGKKASEKTVAVARTRPSGGHTPQTSNSLNT